MRKLAGLALLSLLAACGPKTVPLPTVVEPKFPDLVEPAVPSALAGSAASASAQDRGWRFLQAGDLKNAEREFTSALTVDPAFYPAEASLGYLELAGRKDAKASAAHFDRALERDPAYVPALVGRGDALVALGREAEARQSFEAALAADPSLADVRRRVEVLKFRGVEQNLAAARQAARAGRLDEAGRAYASAIASSPDSAFLYRELAGVERQKGDRDAALADYRKAATLDPSDASSVVQIGDLLEAGGDLDGATKAYADALAIEQNPDVEAKLDATRARLELAQLPEEYRAIDTSAQITRADLAALVGVRLAPLLQGARRRDAVVVTDVRDSWASPWIMPVVRAGIMEPFANHTFQPRTLVRRADLAEVVSRLLARLPSASGAPVRQWEASRQTFSDVQPGHLAYPAASMAIASGVMTVAADGAFLPSKPVSGAEAEDAIARIARLAKLGPQPGAAKR